MWKNILDELNLENLEIQKDRNSHRELNSLEKEKMYLAEDIIGVNEETFNPWFYLYHGIRFQDYLEKLERILKDKKILAAKYLPDAFPYYENCNKGEYVSLLSYHNKQAFDVFIKENISLLVSPKCKAYLTKYVDYNTWIEIQNKETKNLYSYMEQEYMCKDFVSLDFVKAIGVPYKYYTINKGIEYADNILNDVEKLLEKYNYNINIVDTSDFNKILIERKKIRIK